EKSGVEVRPGDVAEVVLRLESAIGRLNVTLQDENGAPLSGIEVAVSGPQSARPAASPAVFVLAPGKYRVIVPPSAVNGKHYRAKEVTATVLANHTEEVPVSLEPYFPTPQAGSISIDPGWLNLNVHDDYELGAAVYDDQGKEMPGALVTWSSS